MGASLRTPLLTAYRFHADEALFAALARHIAQHGDFFLAHTGLLVDKPPLFFLMLAYGVNIEWGSELTARLPGFWCGLLSIALAGRLATSLFGTLRAAWVAGAAFALNPFTLNFAPTAFADPQMLMWWLAALLALSLRRWGWAGVLTGCALATKQNGLFLLPVLGMLALDRDPTPADVLRYALGLAPVLLLAVAWNAARPADFWAAGVAANNPGRLIRPAELLPRLRTWTEYLRVAMGGSLGSVALLAATTAALCHAARRERRLLSAMGLFVAGYVGFHLLVAFPTLDRYALPLAAVAVLTFAWAAEHLPGWVAPLLIVALLPALGIRIGGDGGVHDGIDEVAAVLAAQPPGTIVYYQNLGWELSAYLFDEPLVFVDAASPTYFADDLYTFGHQPAERYLLLPGWVPHGYLLEAARARGWHPDPILETHNRFGEVSFVLYHLRQQ